VKLVFSKGQNVVSDIICGVTGEPASHFAVLLYEATVPIILQSNFLGVDFQSFKMFSQKETIIRTLDFPMTQAREDGIFDSIVNTMVGESYDFGALSYFAWRMSLRRGLGIPVPDKNAWAKSNEAICVKVAMALPDDVIPAKVKTLDLSMKTPWGLYGLLGGT
jgi:hypothetical protein